MSYSFLFEIHWQQFQLYILFIFSSIAFSSCVYIQTTHSVTVITCICILKSVVFTCNAFFKFFQQQHYFFATSAISANICMTMTSILLCYIWRDDSISFCFHCHFCLFSHYLKYLHDKNSTFFFYHWFN